MPQDYGNGREPPCMWSFQHVSAGFCSWFYQGTGLDQIDGAFRSHGPIQLTLQRIQQQVHLAMLGPMGLEGRQALAAPKLKVKYRVTELLTQK